MQRGLEPKLDTCHFQTGMFEHQYEKTEKISELNLKACSVNDVLLRQKHEHLFNLLLSVQHSVLVLVMMASCSVLEALIFFHQSLFTLTLCCLLENAENHLVGS